MVKNACKKPWYGNPSGNLLVSLLNITLNLFYIIILSCKQIRLSFQEIRLSFKQIRLSV